MLGIFLDTETNGLDARMHKILEIAFKIVDLSNGEVKRRYVSLISHPFETWEKSDLDSLKINGFTWDEIKCAPGASKIAQEIIDLFKEMNIRRKEAVFICQNPSFDRAFFGQLIAPSTQEMLSWPYHWLDLASMFWALALDKAKRLGGPLPWEIGFSKDSIAAYYQLPPEEKPHRAMNGVKHLLLCYQAVVGFTD